MRDAERLVQIEMADIGADVARPAEADLRIHVGAVHINLAAVRMDDLAHAPDIRFEYTVCGRIGQHQRR